MSEKSFSPEFKLKVLKEYHDRDCSVNELCKKYNITKTTLRRWRLQYKHNGGSGLTRSHKKYSKQLKEAAVRDYLSGEYSLFDIVFKYNISTDTVLRKWIKSYNSHRELKDSPKGMSNSMTKRKTTLEERIQIVLYCLEHNKNYQLAAETYEVSYQQVYQWVKKYEVGGEDALHDKRGRNKDEQELTAEEKFKLEMKRLERENERLRAENAFLKKLEEIERRRR
jgi:transposase